jgi:ElaB/YqjD/DUF883 family membrane-anchored ribosome-binding protein
VDREQPELIEREMAETRESLTEKVSLLEQKVVGQIQSATDAVQDTVQSVRSAVQDTVESVTGTVTESVESLTDGVKDALDIPRHVRNNPWAMVGGATVAGLVTGLLVFRRPTSGASLPAYTPMPAAAGYAPAASPRPAWINDLMDLAGRELKKLAEQALATTTSSLKQTVEEGIPKLIDSTLPDVGHRRTPSPTDGIGTATATGYYGPGRASNPDMSR